MEIINNCQIYFPKYKYIYIRIIIFGIAILQLIIIRNYYLYILMYYKYNDLNNKFQFFLQ